MLPPSLIADDTPLNVELLEEVLRSVGFRTCSAESGPQGMAMSRKDRPDLILLDVMTPGETGSGIFSALVLQRKDIEVSGDRFFLDADGMIESVPGRRGRVVSRAWWNPACRTGRSHWARRFR
jgi:hypothetical protein